MELICTLLFLYSVAIFATIILTWFPLQQGSPLAKVYTVLWRITDPVLGPVRRTIPPVRIGAGMIDLSPIIVFFAIAIIRSFIGC